MTYQGCTIKKLKNGNYLLSQINGKSVTTFPEEFESIKSAQRAAEYWMGLTPTGNIDAFLAH